MRNARFLDCTSLLYETGFGMQQEVLAKMTPGCDPKHLILMMNLGLGLCTPPVGACLFVGCAVGNVPIERAVRTIWPFYAAILIALLLTSFVPAISLTLPNLLVD